MSIEIFYNEKKLRNDTIFFHSFLYWRLYCLSNNQVAKNFTYILGADKNVIMKHCIHLLEYKFLEVFVWRLTANLHCIGTAEPCTMIFNNQKIHPAQQYICCTSIICRLLQLWQLQAVNRISFFDTQHRLWICASKMLPRIKLLFTYTSNFLPSTGSENFGLVFLSSKPTGNAL